MPKPKTLTKKDVKRKVKASGLSTIYNELNTREQREFRDYCITTFKTKLRTVQNWISGATRPAYIEQLTIAAYLKKTVEQIWEPLTEAA